MFVLRVIKLTINKAFQAALGAEIGSSPDDLEGGRVRYATMLVGYVSQAVTVLEFQHGNRGWLHQLRLLPMRK